MAMSPVRAANNDSNADGRRVPNIVLIMADDMGFECVGANGGESYKTPNLDRLASGGMRFEHCHSQPICTPSRVQIMTGLYNQRNYIRFGLLDPRAKTFAHCLREAGYRTCVVGKWQLQGGFEGPDHFGFDEYCLWQLTRRPNRYPNPGLEINGKEVDFKNGRYGPDLVCDYACDFLERNADRPFLLYYPMILPHWPFEPTPDSVEWDPAARRDDATEKGANTTSEKFFADMVAYTDKMVGRVVAKLDELKLRENTLVLFTGDNGTMTGIRSRLDGLEYVGGKGSTKDNGTHVPLIASWPGRIAPSKVCNDLVDFSDMLPTLVAAAGAKRPRGVELDGRSFLPQLLGETGEPRTWIYCWYARNGGPTGKELARNQEYKLYSDGAFYHVAVDPQEKQPLADDALSKSQRDIRAFLQAALDKHRGTRRPESFKEQPKNKRKKKA
ncbi:MAG: sulfatase-like hydrolase/transferase [Planctomycetales bacterium]|nr:sulfatase-like hydrolase/transferase [Planctomycetales bacterium]